MEYRIFHFTRNRTYIPYYIRLFFAVICLLLCIIPIVLPIFPGSLFIGVVILVVGILLLVPGRKVRHVIKLRKGIVYLFTNIHRKNLIKLKMYDIKKHVKKIIENRVR